MEIRPARWSDLEAVVDLLAVQSRAATGISATRLAFVRGEWELPGFEVGRDNLVAEEDGRIVGYCAVSPKHELVLASADAELADELLSRVTEAARRRGCGAIRVTVVSAEDPMRSVVGRHPFELESETMLMWRSLHERPAGPRWPDGIAVRTFEAGDALAVHELLDEAYGGWDRRYVPVAHDDWTRWMTRDAEFDPAVWWLAMRDGELAGCALHWESGWLKDLAVRASERGCGLGEALVRQGLAEFTRRGARRVGLKVDAANPTGAVRLYERLGFVTERREAVWALSL